MNRLALIALLLSSRYLIVHRIHAKHRLQVAYIKLKDAGKANMIKLFYCGQATAVLALATKGRRCLVYIMYMHYIDSI